MIAGRHRCPPVLYVAVIAVVVALVLVGFWSRYHTHEVPVRTPLHDPK
jgi:uncharacterized membrane protein YhhN